MAKKKNNNKKAAAKPQSNEQRTENEVKDAESTEQAGDAGSAEATVADGTAEPSPDQTATIVDHSKSDGATKAENEERDLAGGAPIKEGKSDQNEEGTEIRPKDRGTDDARVKELESQIAELTLKLEKAEGFNVKEDPVKDTATDDEEVTKVKEQLKATEEERDKIQVQYEGLLSRLGSMKSVFSKMKESQAELEETTERLEEYEKQNMQLKKKIDILQREKQDAQSVVKVLKEEGESLNAECDRLSQELRTIENLMGDKQSLWDTEKRSLVATNHMQLEQIEKLKESNEEYVITLENDKMVNSSLNHDITILNDKVADLEATIDRLKKENDSYRTLNDSVNGDLQHLQRNLDLASQKHLKALKTLEEELEIQRSQYDKLKEQNMRLQEESAKASRFEQEVKEKQLQIGKLRHEAVILNEHLTKALQLIKRNSDAETVDKELVTNLFISFLNIPRGDTKKFEVLQLISNYLNWDEDKRIQAGLSHNANASRSKQARESFVSLWTEYLENESVKQ